MRQPREIQIGSMYLCIDNYIIILYIHTSMEWHERIKNRTSCFLRILIFMLFNDLQNAKGKKFL